MAVSKIPKHGVLIGTRATRASIDSNVEANTPQYLQIAVDDYMLIVSASSIYLYDRINSQVVHKVNWDS